MSTRTLPPSPNLDPSQFDDREIVAALERARRVTEQRNAAAASGTVVSRTPPTTPPAVPPGGPPSAPTAAAPTPEPADAPDAPKRLLSRDEVLDARDVRVEDVPVDEWKRGGFVRVRTVTAADRDRMEMAIFTNETGPLTREQIRSRVVAMSVVDAEGAPLFAPADVARLSAKSAAPMNRIYEAALRLNGISETDVDDLAKNSGAASGATS